MAPSILFLCIAFVFFTLLFVMVGIIFLKIKQLNTIEQRVRIYMSEMMNENEEIKIKKFRTPRFISVMGKNLKGLPMNKDIKKLLEEAALPIKLEDFFVIRMVLGVALFILTSLFGYNVFICLGLLIIGYWIPFFYVKYRRQRRLARCVNQLSETLGIMANSLRAGFSFMQAMQLIGREMPDPIGPEFDRTFQEISYGVPFEKAFENMMKRLPDKDLEIALNALLIQRKSGGNLAELLETIQGTVQGRLRIKDEIKTLTAEGRISGIIITLLPIALGLYFYIVNPDYFNILFEEPLGWVILTLGSVSIIVGWVFIRKIIRIEV